MISIVEIDGKLISSQVFEEKFVCDLSACKGACCVEGDAGAPITTEEAGLLEDELENILPYLRPEGVKSIEKEGVFTIDWDGEKVTPLVNHKECAFAIFEKDGTAKCGIEKAWENGDATIRKPISCHLYPIRVAQYEKYEALNYHEWKICEPACECGSKLNVPVFKFLKNALIQKYGASFYSELELVYDEMKSNKD